jgi:hypothetical protein
VTGMLRGSLIALAVPPKEEHVLPRQSLYQVVQKDFREGGFKVMGEIGLQYEKSLHQRPQR